MLYAATTLRLLFLSLSLLSSTVYCFADAEVLAFSIGVSPCSILASSCVCIIFSGPLI